MFTVLFYGPSCASLPAMRAMLLQTSPFVVRNPAEKEFCGESSPFSGVLYDLVSPAQQNQRLR